MAAFISEIHLFAGKVFTFAILIDLCSRTRRRITERMILKARRIVWFYFSTTAMALFISKDIISHAPNAIEPLLFIRNKVINIVVYRAAADAEQSRPAPNSSLFPFYTENPMMLEKTNQIANMRDAYRSNFNFSSSHNLLHKSYSAKSRVSASNMPMEIVSVSTDASGVIRLS